MAIRDQIFAVSGIKILTFLGSGIKILGKNMRSVTKKYTSFFNTFNNGGWGWRKRRELCGTTIASNFDN